MAVRIKGQAFLGFLSTLQRLKGMEARAQLVAHLPHELTQALASGEIVAMGWYSLDWYCAMHTQARALFGDAVSRDVGREATRQDVNSIYRFILKFFSPETLLNQSEKVFGLFCEGGTCRVESTTRGTARIRYADCPGATRGMWESVLGSTEMLVELCGGKGVVGRALDGGADGSPTLVAHFSWTP